MNKPSQSVYFFSTCLIDTYYPNFGMDALALLKLCGFDVIIPQAQTCCGQPPFNSGYSDQSIPVVKATLDIFSASDTPLIVPSASCAAMIKHHYPTLFPEQSPEYQQALHLSGKTFELIDFLVDALPYENSTDDNEISVGLHQSCSAMREMKVADSWLRILEQLNQVTVVTPQYSEECCGFGGTFAVKSPEISAAMTEDKCRHLAQTEADLIVTGDTGCLMNIEGMYRKQFQTANTGLSAPKTNDNLPKITHIVSFLADRFGVAYEP